jgi:dihydropteroate synthase
MGIVNLTPDSFSDGGHHLHLSQALRHAEQLLQEGAGILDVGAESTRPGAEPVSLDEELARLMPFLREAVRWQVPISVDTYKPEVMQAVLDLGVDIVNDIWALRQPGAERVVASHPSCGVCLMHMHRDPKTMQINTMDGDVVSVVKFFLDERVQSLLRQGVDAARLVLDPGIGFGKSVAQNFQLLAHQSTLMDSVGGGGRCSSAFRSLVGQCCRSCARGRAWGSSGACARCQGNGGCTQSLAGCAVG